MSEHPNKLAADMVAQQIVSYESQLASLEEQLRQTVARIEAVKLIRDALMPLLGNGPLPPKTSPLPPSGPVSRSANANPILVDSSAPTSSSTDDIVRTSSGTGFADAVRTVLKDYPRGLPPSDVAEQMKMRGSASIYTGKTPFSIRVGNELHRLMKAGEVGRRSGRYYLMGQEQHA